MCSKNEILEIVGILKLNDNIEFLKNYDIQKENDNLGRQMGIEV